MWMDFCLSIDYIEIVLKRFNMNKSHPLSSYIVFQSPDVKEDPFHPQNDN